MVQKVLEGLLNLDSAVAIYYIMSKALHLKDFLEHFEFTCRVTM